MNKIGIVVIGYNRVDSIQRLIGSLCQAKYSQKVDLIVSIDNSGTSVVEEYAKAINWPFGEKIIKTFPERLGLKNHVFTCGNYINEFNFDALIVLEDDLFVSPDFFNFSVQAVERYKEEKEIAGISLYSHSWNINADRPFLPIYKGYDVFYMKYPQSWGQVWMKEQWNDFYSWYESGDFEAVDRNKIPGNVLNWPKSSWLKFHVMYCVDKGKYFVYPYNSLSTNFADAGTHYAFSTNKMQVSLTLDSKENYTFPNKKGDTSLYDAYFENEQLSCNLDLKQDELVVDLFGKKTVYDKRYVLSTRVLPYKIIKSFDLQMRPWELNIIYRIQGDGIYLYDTNYPESKMKPKHNSMRNWVYDTKGEIILKRNFVDIMFCEILNKLKK